jgi:quercetin dioxygenase-like cupin family protein
MFATKRVHVLSTAVLFALLAIAAIGPSRTSAREEQALDPPCITGVTVHPIGQSMPEDGEGRAHVLLRLTIGSGGGFTTHTHPGTLIVSVEAGTLELTQLDDMTMDVMRAATDAEPAMSELMTMGVPTTFNPGDWFVEPEGMVHTAINNGSVPAVVLVSGLVDPNLPFVQCVASTPTA